MKYFVYLGFEEGTAGIQGIWDATSCTSLCMSVVRVVLACLTLSKVCTVPLVCSCHGQGWRCVHYSGVYYARGNGYLQMILFCCHHSAV